MLLLLDRNYLDLEATYNYVLNDLGADKLKINVLQPTFGLPPGTTDKFFAEHGEMDADKLRVILGRCNHRFSLGINPEWVDQVVSYVRTVAATPSNRRGWHGAIVTIDHICNSHDRNVVVDPTGVARLCVSERFLGFQLRRPGDLRYFWEHAGRIRSQMTTCNQLCGITHSMRRVSSTLAGATHFD